MHATRRHFITQLGLGTVAGISSRLFADARPMGSLLRSTPEMEGVSSAGILAFLDAIAQGKSELHSFMMLRHGKVVAEGWWSPYAADLRHTMYSMSKSFTSTAVGLAVAEGKLTVDDKVTSFFPNDLPEQISENLAKLRVKHLLSMAVGNEKEPTGTVVKEENWVKAFLAQSITHEPGSTFLYNSAATYMCSAIVQKVTGQRVIDYLTPRLFTPLGISGMTWETCPRGINTGGWGLSIQTEGLAKFGQLYLQKGKWNGKQLIPESWVEQATTFKIQQPTSAKPPRDNAHNDWLQGYCYQFWRCQHNAFRGDGAFGQFTIVMPEQDAVVIMTSETKDMQGELDLVWQYLLPAINAGTLPADEASNEKLKQALGTLKLSPPKAKPTSDLAAKISGKTWKLEDNSLGISAIGLVFEKDECAFTARAGDKTHRIAHGLERWVRGETAMPGTPPRLIAGNPGVTSYKTVASATWLDDNTLELTWRYIETPHRDTVTLKFDGERVTVNFLGSIVAMGNKKDTRPVLKGVMG